MLREGLWAVCVLVVACGGKGEQSAPLLVAGGSPSDGGGASSSGSAARGGEAPGGTGSGAAGGSSEPAAGSGGVAGAVGSAGASGSPTGGTGGKGGQGGAAGKGGGGAGGTAAGRAGDGGEPAGGDGGAGGAPEPDDTGCIDRPWSGNLGNLDEKLPIYDCSSCSTAAVLDYTDPEFCAPADVCSVIPDVAALAGDSIVLLPAQGGKSTDFCQPQACKGEGGAPEELPGYVLQLAINVPTGATVRVQVDEHRRILTRTQPLLSCSSELTCYRVQGQVQLAIVAAPDAPRGQVRISTGQQAGTVCP